MKWTRLQLPEDFEPAKQQLLAVLSVGGALAGQVAERINTSDGIWLICSCDVTSEALRDLSRGVWGDRSIAIEGLVDLFRDYLIHASKRCVLLENLCARRGDSILCRFQSRLVFLVDEVLHVLGAHDCGNTVVRNAIMEAESAAGFIGYCCRDEQLVAVESKADITQVLSQLASAIDCVVVSALDGEAYLVWRLEGRKK